MWRLSPSIRAIFTLTLVLCTATLASHSLADSADAANPSADTQVTAGSMVSLEYKLTLEDGRQESNAGKEPMVFVQGAQQIIPGIDEAVIGMRIGEKKTVTIEPKMGYGMFDPEAFREVRIDGLPSDKRRVGAQIVSMDGTLGRVVFRVKGIDGDKATLDGNHPLAGQTLNFDIKVLAIE